MSSRASGLGQRVERAKAAIISVTARSVLWVLRHLPLGDRAERFLLERTWGAGSAEMLDAYLVAGYQNPRINIQSILVRHFLLARLLGDEVDATMEDEIRFAVELNEVLRQRARELGVQMGAYRNPVKHAAVRRVDEAIAERERAFGDRWREILADRPADRLSVIEFACGSANDYRAFAETGLATRLEYVGVDLSPKNIANARRRFPDVRFEVGDILGLPYPDRSFDYVVASDIFEHLSPEAMEAALDEAVRLARRGLVLTFFNMSDAPEHEVRRRRAYHWNTLSRPRIEARLRQDFASVSGIPVARWLKASYDYPHSYNTHAWTIFAEREAGLSPTPHAWPQPPAAG
jgi:SAM-dependent methyltransferase